MALQTHETAPTRFIEANGIRYAYRSFGKESGVPLVFLQHFRGTMDDWDPAVVNGLAKDRPVVLFDNAGIARSGGETPDTIAEMARDALAVIEALGLRQIDLLGFSIGGFVAQQVALDRPDLVRRVILVGTGPQGGEGMDRFPPAVQADAACLCLFKRGPWADDRDKPPPCLTTCQDRSRVSPPTVSKTRSTSEAIPPRRSLHVHPSKQSRTGETRDQTSEMPRLLAFLKLLRDERERGLGHFTPSVVNGQGMPATGYFMDLRHAGIFLLLLVGGMGDRPRHGVVVLARDDQQGSTLGILRVDLGFRPWVEIGGGRLEDRHTGAGHRVFLVQLVRFVLVHGVSEGVTELLVGQRDGAGVVQWVAQDRRRRFQRRERQGEHAAEGSGVDGDRHGGHALPGHLLRDEAAEGMADDGRLGLELADGVDVVIGDLLDPLVGKDLRIAFGLLNGVRVIGPAWGQRGVALLFEQRAPVIPTACEKPQAVHEHDRLPSRGVGAVDLLLFMGRKICHFVLLSVCQCKLLSFVDYHTCEQRGCVRATERYD
jgi:pimeloyl-ACP methyl ester carboxylesterase